MKIRSKVLKDGKLHFYNGNKKATPQEQKQFIKTNYNIIPPEKLDASQRRYLGQVKGGKSKSANTLVNKKGQFLPKNLQDKALKNLGIDIEALRKAKQVKTIREIFKDNKALQESFDNLIERTGLPFWYNPDKLIEKVNGYTGDNIYVIHCDSKTDNKDFYKLLPKGELIGKGKAGHIINSYVKQLNRVYDFFDMSLILLYLGTDKLYFAIDANVLATGEDSYIMEPTQEHSIIQIYHS